jgi:hypothetical protein
VKMGGGEKDDEGPRHTIYAEGNGERRRDKMTRDKRDYRLNMKLDLHSLFGLLCISVLID